MSAATLQSKASVSQLMSEERLSMSQASKLLNQHITSTHRQATRGVAGVVLESLKVAGKRVTTREAVMRFIERLNADIDQHDEREDASAIQQRSKQAAKALEALGC